MDILTILKANIRHQKSSFFGIMIIMAIVTMALTSVLTININSRDRDTMALKEDGFGDMFIMIRDVDLSDDKFNEMLDAIKQSHYVEQVKNIRAIYAKIANLNDEDDSDPIIMEPFKQDCFSFHIFNEQENGFRKNAAALKKGEIAVPISFKSLYNCKLGDTLYVMAKEKEKGYRIKYFYEDPFSGSAMMGMKTVLINEEDLNELEALAATDNNINSGNILNIFQAKDSHLSYLKFEKAINQDTGIEAYSALSLGTEQAQGYMLILTNLFSGILVVFIVLLLIVALIVMSHSINSSIEMEYVNLGILKALGFTQRKLSLVLLFQYLLAVLFGAVVGIPLALPVITLMNKMTMPVIGLLVSDKLAITPLTITLLGIISFITIFICLKLSKLKWITPVQAINGGRENIYFSSRLEFPVHKRGMNFWLAYRQLTSNGRQYISAGIVTTLLIIFLVMVSTMGTWVGDEGEGIIQLFSSSASDLEVNYGDTDLQEEVEKSIESYTKIKGSYELASSYLLMDGYKIFSFVISDPHEYNTILKGRTCLYDNEILITKMVAKDLGLDIGDTVILSDGEKKEEFMISGIYQCGNDLGMNIALNKKGFDKLSSSYNPYMEYRLGDKQVISELAQHLKDKYGSEIKILKTTDSLGALDSVVIAVKGFSMVVYLMSIIFVIIVIFLICTKVYAKEQKDYGIYKALGFTSRRIRLQFALRFFFVAVFGSVIGSVLSIVLTNPCIGFMFSFLGISSFHGTFTWQGIMQPIIFMSMLFFLFSYLLSYKIKKVEPRILITQ